MRHLNIILFFIILATASIGYSQANQIHCAPPLKKVLEKVRELPEADDLLYTVLQQGPLFIELNTDKPDQFDGYWSCTDRTIYITQLPQSSDCFLITALLFELQNALRTEDIEELYSLASYRAIGREDFIESLEYIEYENAYNTSSLLREGVASGVYPSGCYWHLSDDFSEHLKIQEDGGHCDWIGKLYDQLVLASIS